MHKQLLKYVKVIYGFGLKKKTNKQLCNSTFLGTEGKSMKGNMELAGKQFLS